MAVLFAGWWGHQPSFDRAQSCFYLQTFINLTMIFCAIYGCNNSNLTTDESIQYYYFPKHHILAQQWLNLCLWKDELDLQTARICSVHFDADSYSPEFKLKTADYNGRYIKMLKHDAMPSLNLHRTTMAVSKSSTDNLIEAKELIVYDLENPQYIYSTTENSDLKFDTTDYVIQDVETLPEIKVIEDKCKNITDEKFSEIIKQNSKLRQSIHKAKERNSRLKKKIVLSKRLYDELTQKYVQQDVLCSKLRKRSLKVQDQMVLLKKVFSDSQIKILTGKKKIYWSNDDMAIGYTIRHMSSKRCYTYLTKNLNIPLPALSSIKRWATLKKGDKDDKTNVLVKEDDSE